MKLRRILSFMMALLLVCSFPVSVFAAEYDLAQGSVIVNATETGQTVTPGSNAAVADDAPVITQSNSSTPTSNTVTITAAADTTANVTLSGVNIDTGTSGGAAVEIKGNGDVRVRPEDFKDYLQKNIAKLNGTFLQKQALIHQTEAEINEISRQIDQYSYLLENEDLLIDTLEKAATNMEGK